MNATFPLWYALLPYALVLLGSTIYFFFNVYHIAKYGLQTTASTVVLAIYFLLFFGVAGATFAFIGSVNWSTKLHVADIIPVGTSSTNFGL